MIISSFPPIENEFSKILIVGTMPSVKSLEEKQFYAHPQNQFWKIMFSLFDKPYTTDYAVKKELLLDNHIALWDVLKNCVREGSMDSNIRKAIPNDFNNFFNTHNIGRVFCNGQASYKYFKKFVNPSIEYTCLPSTSPANARMSYDEKFKIWSQLKNHL